MCVCSPQALLQPIVWSLNVLFEGIHPRLNADGFAWDPTSGEAARAGKELFPEGIFAVTWHLCADREFAQRYLGMPSPNSLFPCPWCRTTSADGPNNFRNFKDGAGWKTTELSKYQARV